MSTTSAELRSFWPAIFRRISPAARFTSTAGTWQPPAGTESPATTNSPGVGGLDNGERVAELPSGTVTFLFTDLEGSTRLWERDPDARRHALKRHDELLDAAIVANGGVVLPRLAMPSSRRSCSRRSRPRLSTRTTRYA